MPARITKKNLLVARCLAAAAMLAVFAATHGAMSQGTPEKDVMIVLDGSGSMWGKLGQENDTKLALSQRFLTDLLNNPARKGRWGLASFGHRRAGNCSDAQVIVPPATGSKEDMLRVIEKHNPRGKGPLSLALTKTAEALDPAKDSNILLVHDGYDNCRQDPCAVASALSKSHPKLAIHVISLDLPDATVKTMSCLANQTGGRMYPVRTEAQFAKAAQAFFETTSGKTGIAGSDAESESATAPGVRGDASKRDQGPPRIVASAVLNSGAEQNVRDVSWEVTSPADPNTLIADTDATVLRQRMDAGRYIVRGRSGLAQNEAQVTVRESGETAVQLNLDAGVLRFANLTSNSVAADASDPTFVTIRKPADAKQQAADAPLWIGAVSTTQSLVVPAGQYRVDMQIGPSKIASTVTVTSGKITEVPLALEYGTLKLTSTIADQAAPPTDSKPSSLAGNQRSNVTYIVRIDDPTQPGGRRELARSAAHDALFRLTPGTVYVEAHLGRARQEKRFAITKGSMEQHTFAFQVATLTLSAAIGDDLVDESFPVTYTVFDISNTTAKQVAVVSRKSPTLTLPAGRYRVQGNITKSVTGTAPAINLTAGQNTKATIPLTAGRVELVPPAGGRKSSLPRLQIRQAGGDGKVVWSGRVARKTTAILAPGHYLLEKRARQQPITEFAVQAGTRTTLNTATPR